MKNNDAALTAEHGYLWLHLAHPKVQPSHSWAVTRAHLGRTGITNKHEHTH